MDPTEPVGCYSGVVVFNDNAIPDMFVHLTPVAYGVEARVSELTWQVLNQRGAIVVAFLREVRDRSGGYALTGSPFDAAAANRGVRRRLRAA